jgi:hypothetical protein
MSGEASFRFRIPQYESFSEHSGENRSILKFCSKECQVGGFTTELTINERMEKRFRIGAGQVNGRDPNNATSCAHVTMILAESIFFEEGYAPRRIM